MNEKHARKLPVLKLVWRAAKAPFVDWRFMLTAGWLTLLAYAFAMAFQGVLGDSWPTELLDYLLPALVFVPMALAIHRRVLLGEFPGSFTYWRPSSLYLKYLLYAFLLEQLLLLLLLPINEAFEYAFITDRLTGWLSVVLSFVGFSILILFPVVIVRYSMILPAIAIERAGFGLRQARELIRGNGWRYFFGFLLIFLPVVSYSIMFDLQFDDEAVFFSAPVAVTTLVSWLMVVVYCFYYSFVFAYLTGAATGGEDWQ